MTGLSNVGDSMINQAFRSEKTKPRYKHKDNSTPKQVP